MKHKHQGIRVDLPKTKQSKPVVLSEEQKPELEEDVGLYINDSVDTAALVEDETQNITADTATDTDTAIDCGNSLNQSQPVIPSVPLLQTDTGFEIRMVSNNPDESQDEFEQRTKQFREYITSRLESSEQETPSEYIGTGTSNITSTDTLKRHYSYPQNYFITARLDNKMFYFPVIQIVTIESDKDEAYAYYLDNSGARKRIGLHMFDDIISMITCHPTMHKSDVSLRDTVSATAHGGYMRSSN